MLSTASIWLVNGQSGKTSRHGGELLGEKFMVYDVGFKDVPAVLAEADRRLCRYKDRCGCGDAA